MNNFIFIAGGARSGKSTFAQKVAARKGKKVVFIATCIPRDKEMKKRVMLHKKSRPRHWKTIEEDKRIAPVLKKLHGKYDVVIIDCMALFISNLLGDGKSLDKIEKQIANLAKSLAKAAFTSIVVSNEVGEGIVPANALARDFRDMLGITNQVMAKYADSVYIMHMGIANQLKGEKESGEAESCYRKY